MTASIPMRMPRPIALALLAFAGVLAFSPVRAEDNGAASAAVAKLLSAPVTPEAPAETASPASGSEHLMVSPQPGETLDRLIRRVMPSQPFKEDFIRRAFFRLNPKLANTSPYRALPSSMSLAVPSGHDLRQQMVEQYPAMGKTLFEASAPVVKTDDTPAPGAGKRRWVQFP